LATKPAPTSNKERYALSDHKVICYRQKYEIEDPLAEILRAGAPPNRPAERVIDNEAAGVWV
jgi:hypothetical protein